VYQLVIDISIITYRLFIERHYLRRIINIFTFIIRHKRSHYLFTPLRAVPLMMPRWWADAMTLLIFSSHGDERHDVMLRWWCWCVLRRHISCRAARARMSAAKRYAMAPAKMPRGCELIRWCCHAAPALLKSSYCWCRRWWYFSLPWDVTPMPILLLRAATTPSPITRDYTPLDIYADDYIFSRRQEDIRGIGRR